MTDETPPKTLTEAMYARSDDEPEHVPAKPLEATEGAPKRESVSKEDFEKMARSVRKLQTGLYNLAQQNVSLKRALTELRNELTDELSHKVDMR